MASADSTIIGRGTRVRGRVTGGHDVRIEGHLEGELEATGEVVVEQGGTVGATIHARRVVVRGAVKGDLNGAEAVLLEEGARVVGDVHAPRIAIAPGALLRGYVQTGEGGAPLPGARRPAQAARPAPAAQAAPAKVAVKAPAKPAPKAAPARRPPPPARASAPKVTGKKASAVAISGAKSPPRPVVPALKKGARGALTKKK